MKKASLLEKCSLVLIMLPLLKGLKYPVGITIMFLGYSTDGKVLDSLSFLATPLTIALLIILVGTPLFLIAALAMSAYSVLWLNYRRRWFLFTGIALGIVSFMFVMMPTPIINKLVSVALVAVFSIGLRSSVTLNPPMPNNVPDTDTDPAA